MIQEEEANELDMSRSVMKTSQVYGSIFATLFETSRKIKLVYDDLANKSSRDTNFIELFRMITLFTMIFQRIHGLMLERCGIIKTFWYTMCFWSQLYSWKRGSLLR